MLNTSKVLVFGGNKFVGLHLVRTLKKYFQPANIFCLTRSVQPDSSVNNLKADRCNHQELSQTLKNLEFDYVFDLSTYQLSDLEPSLFVLQGRVKTWFLMSSAGVYAPAITLPYKYNSPPINKQPHLGKLEAEIKLKEQKDLHSFVFRPFYIYGPNNSFDRETFLFRALEAEQTILLPSEGLPVLQLIYVQDLVELIVQAALLPSNQTQHQIFHACQVDLFTLNSLLAICAQVVKKQAKVQYYTQADLKAFGAHSRQVFPLRAEHYFGDCQALNKLGLKAKTTLEEGLKQTYTWYQANREQFPLHTITELGQKLLAK